jgi:hypothetical protein
LITKLQLGEFKAFRHERLSLRPLTVFVGENNSGKSSLLAAIRLLAQTVQSTDQTVPLVFSGPLGDFGSYRDVVHGHHRARPLTLGLTVDGHPKRKALGPYSFTSEFKYRTQRRETILRSTKVIGANRPLITVASSGEADRLVISTVRSWTVPDTARGSLRRSLRMVNFLPRVMPEFLGERSRSSDVTRAVEALGDIRHEEFRAFDAFVSTLRGVEFVGAMRRPPERTYVNTGTAGERIGADGGNWPALLALESGRRASRENRLRGWMRKAGLARDIDVSWLSDRHYEILVTHPVSGETANVADVGQGTTQVLPVVVAGSRLGRGDLFIVEEPEIHLHPRAQAALGDFFVDLALSGVQCLVETHSEYLILRLQQRIAKGDMSPNDAVFYYVSSHGEGKAVTALHLDGAAAFRELIPGGFFPERIDEARKLVEARGSAAAWQAANGLRD